MNDVYRSYFLFQSDINVEWNFFVRASDSFPRLPTPPAASGSRRSPRSKASPSPRPVEHLQTCLHWQLISKLSKPISIFQDLNDVKRHLTCPLSDVFHPFSEAHRAVGLPPRPCRARSAPRWPRWRICSAPPRRRRRRSHLRQRKTIFTSLSIRISLLL